MSYQLPLAQPRHPSRGAAASRSAPGSARRVARPSPARGGWAGGRGRQRARRARRCVWDGSRARAWRRCRPVGAPRRRGSRAAPVPPPARWGRVRNRLIKTVGRLKKNPKNKNPQKTRKTLPNPLRFLSVFLASLTSAPVAWRSAARLSVVPQDDPGPARTRARRLGRESGGGAPLPEEAAAP